MESRQSRSQYALILYHFTHSSYRQELIIRYAALINSSMFIVRHRLALPITLTAKIKKPWHISSPGSLKFMMLAIA